MRTLVYLLIACLALHSVKGWAQLRIASNTDLVATSGTQMVVTSNINNLSSKADFSNIDLILSSSSAQTLITSSALTIRSLEVNSAGDYTINGTITISEDLVLTLGKLIVDAAAASPGVLIYAGTNDISTGSATSYVDGILYTQGSGQRTFPIGNSSGYFPARLENLSDASAVVGFQVIDGDPQVTIPSDIVEVFTDHYWKFHTRGGGFSNAVVSVSSNGTDAFLGTSNFGILQLDTDGNTTNLQGALVTGGYLTSIDALGSKADVIAVGKGSGEAGPGPTPVIFNVITPNADGVNDFLKINNIEFYADNEVTFLDRYGVKLFSKQGFTNYTTVDEALRDFNYASLPNGNYICTLKYGKDGKKLAQMITVLK